MITNFANTQITRPTNSFTGLPEGDDAGYRDIPISPLDAENPDDMVVTGIRSYPINFRGQTPGIMKMYPGGFQNAPNKVVVR